MSQRSSAIPALVNSASGTADAATEALTTDARFDVSVVDPSDIASRTGAFAACGTPRVLVAGGDGTIAASAQSLVNSRTELAILPGGTLNHFARDIGIPEDAAAALECAASGTSKPADVGMVNGRLFLNTSSVGSYVHFVRARETLEKTLSYSIASALAAFRVLLDFRSMEVEVEVEGKRRTYRTPLVFIGVGERELQLPTLGNRVANGRRGLHVLVVTGRTRARLFALAMNAVARGVRTAASTPELDSFVVDRCSIATKRHVTVSVDGELVRMQAPLVFEIHRDSLRVVCP